MEIIEVTKESLYEYLSAHRNWIEIEPDIFECCIENELCPIQIQLLSHGAAFKFHKKTTGWWSPLADRECISPYKHLYIVPLDSHSDFAGCLLMDIRVSLLPPGQPLQRPPSPKFVLGIEEDITPKWLSEFHKFPLTESDGDYPDIRLPEE